MRNGNSEDCSGTPSRGYLSSKWRTCSGLWRQWGGALVLALALLPGRGVASVTIDDFETGAFSLSTSERNPVWVKALSAPSAISGLRSVNLLSGATPASLTLALTAGEDALVWDVGTAPNSFFLRYGDWGNDTPPNPSYDFSSGNAFRLVFTDAPASGGKVFIFVVTDVTGLEPESSSPRFPVTGPGEVLIPFSAFPNSELDFGDVDRLLIQVESDVDGVSYVISKIEVVSAPLSGVFPGPAPGDTRSSALGLP